MSATPFDAAPLWYLTRSTGLTAFGLLTATTALGAATTQRSVATSRWPRFATQHLHRNVSLLAVAFVVVHVVTTLLDSFVTVGWPAFVVPFTSPYHRIGVTFGTLSFDALLVLVVTSLLRPRIDARLWRTLHWLGYALWPFAVLHFLTTGTDAAHGRWGVWLALLAIAVVAGAGALRFRAANPPQRVPSVQRTSR